MKKYHYLLKGPRVIPLKKLKAVLWALCRDIIRTRYIKPNGTWNCYTCPTVIEKPQNAHTGHCIPSKKGGVLLRYHLDNLRIQCYSCNKHYGGMGAIFYKKLLEEIGQERVDALFTLFALQEDTGITTENRKWFEEKIEEYESLLNR